MALSFGELPRFGSIEIKCDYQLKVSCTIISRIGLSFIFCSIIHVCIYICMQLTSLPSTNTNMAIVASGNYAAVTSDPPDTVALKCDRVVSETTGLMNIHLQWSTSYGNGCLRPGNIVLHEFTYKLGLGGRKLVKFESTPSSQVSAAYNCTKYLYSSYDFILKLYI